MTAFLATMLSTTWFPLMRQTADLVAWGQLFQEMDITVATLSRDLGGSLPDDGYTAGKKVGRLLGVQQRSSIEPNVLQLWFDGGNNSDTPPTSWNPRTDDTIIEYSCDENYLLKRTTSRDSGHPYTVASLGNPPKDSPNPALKITPIDGLLHVDITFTYHFPHEKYNPDYDPAKFYRYKPLTRKCTLVTKPFPLSP
jgi:hypothetical protein